MLSSGYSSLWGISGRTALFLINSLCPSGCGILLLAWLWCVCLCLVFFLSYLFSQYWLGGLLPLFDLYGDYILAYTSRDAGGYRVRGFPGRILRPSLFRAVWSVELPPGIVGGLCPLRPRPGYPSDLSERKKNYLGPFMAVSMCG